MSDDRDTAVGIETADIVCALHRATFGTLPETDVIVALVSEIGDDPGVLDVVATRLGNLASELKRKSEHSLADHSQDGEYRFLLRELIRAGSRYRVIVDVGANGVEGSNSYDLLTEFGWKGLLIEANPALLPRIRLAFGHTDHILVGCAIGVETGRLPLHLGVHDQISSLIESNAASFGTVHGTVDVEVRRLGDVLDDHDIAHDFDILSLDIEGMDVGVLNDLIATTAYRPLLISIEGSYFGQTQALADIGLSDAVASVYDIAAKTAANLILRRTVNAPVG